MRNIIICTALFFSTSAFAAAPQYDVIIRGGTVYDGSGKAPRIADVAIRGDRIVAIGKLNGSAKRVVNAKGMAVAPGFINVLSWSVQTLLQDGRALSAIKQGVTLEVFGEGWSMGPLTAAMKVERKRRQGDIKYEMPWNTLDGYLRHLQKRGVSCNVASFVGATTIRIHVLGFDNRPPSSAEMKKMKALVQKAMEDGALGVGSSLIYAPAFYADTRELVELSKVAAKYGGIYISHIRSEGNRLLPAVDELLQISRRAKIPAEIYHLKAAGKENHGKLKQVIAMVEKARSKGMRITANMYTYTAGATGLNATMPPWVQEGGFEAWSRRLTKPEIRKQVAKEMRTPSDKWENLLLLSGSAKNVILVGFKNPKLKHLTGKTLAEVAKMRQKTVEETAMDLVIEDGSRVGTVFFFMSEENIKRKIRLPWVSFGCDAAAQAPEGVFLKSNTHPRAYGCFARLLGKYVRDEKVIPMQTAIHKLTQLPAKTLGIRARGSLQPGYFADVVVFDPKTIADRATFSQPHQLSVGVKDVFVNGKHVLKSGKHTGATPGKVVRGPGYWKAKSRRGKVKVTERAKRIHRQSYVFDGHNDLPWQIRLKASSTFARMDISKSQPTLHTDIDRLRKGNVGAQFWSVYVPASTRLRGKSLLTTLEQIKIVKAMVKRYPDVFQMALNSKDIVEARKSGKIASLIGVEGGHSIENSLAVLRQLYKEGARYMTLTHSDTLQWADSATDTAKHGGLNKFGEAVVKEMNRLGMLVDLSHVSPQTMHDALRISKAPIMFSHSSARSIADHPRNVPDDVLMKTAKNGGVVMVNFYSGFIEPTAAKRMQDMFEVRRKLRKKFGDDKQGYRRAVAKWRAANAIPRGSVHDVADHIDHIVRVAGVDHVGIGSDYDGIGRVPEQLEDVSTYPVLTQVLLNRGYTAAEIHKMMSGNIMRVIRGAEAARGR